MPALPFRPKKSREQKSPRRGYYALFLDFFKGDTLAELLVELLKLYFVTGKLLLVFARVQNRARGRL
jgi:hypothetical protein